MRTIYNYLHKFEIPNPERDPRTLQPTTFTGDYVGQLYVENGLSLREVAERIGVSTKALRELMDEHHIARRQPDHELDSTAIAEAYRTGATLSELASEHACSTWLITKQLDTHGVPRREGKRRPTAS